MKKPSLHTNTAGFTMSEMLAATAIGTFIVAGIMTTYLLSVKSFRAIGHYIEIHTAGRQAVDHFARDMRGVYAISSFSASNIVVSIPTAFSGSGGVLSNKTVAYTYSGGALYRTEYGAGTAMLATNIYQLTFMLYDKLGSNTVVLSNAKGVQVDIRLRKYVINQVQSEDYLSARLDMRNKP
jgi:Tfp pilus assembly protein PilW